MIPVVARRPVRGSTRAEVALVHDYLTQCGGAERVVLEMTRAFPGVPVHTSLYDPGGTYPQFAAVDVRPQALNRIGVLARHHRLALPVLAPSFSSTTVDAAVTICSSSGWAHGVRTTGRKVVFCYTPARWLYQGQRYLGQPGEGGAPGRGGARVALSVLGPWLRRWDRQAAASAHRYLVTSREVRRRVQDVYRRPADVLPPPPALTAGHPQCPVPGLEPGYWLCVSRLLPYKNVDAVAGAFASLGHRRLVVVGSGPEEPRLRAGAPPNVTYLGRVSDDQLAWLYHHATGIVAAAHEDYGLTPLEGASFGKPAAVLAWGGYLDTVEEGRTGAFFDQPTPGAIAAAVGRLHAEGWDPAEIVRHAARFSPEVFIDRLREIADEEKGEA